MSVTAALRNRFPGTVRQRGEIYVRQSRVRIRNANDVQVDAIVRGSSDYDVKVLWEGNSLNLWCDCAYFQSDGACKHLWATLLVAEARGYLKGAQPVPSAEPPGLSGRSQVPAGPPAAPQPAWKRQVEILQQHSQPVRPGSWSSRREILYLVDVASSKTTGALVMRLARRDRKQDGSWTANAALILKRYQVQDLPEEADREILSALAGSRQFYGWNDLDGYDPVPECTKLDTALACVIIPLVARTGRCFLQRREMRDPGGEPVPVSWDDGPPWQFALEMRRSDGGWAVNGFFRRGAERIELSAPALVTAGGFLFVENRVSRLAPGTPFEWMMHLRRDGPIAAPAEDGEKLMETLLSIPGLPSLEVPEELRYEEVAGSGRPFLRIQGRSGTRLRADLGFEYEGRLVPAHEKSGGVYQAAEHRFLRRDLKAESEAEKRLADLGLKALPGTPDSPAPSWQLAPSRLADAVRALVQEGWMVEADGKLFRRAGAFRLVVSSGVDWFELHADVEYGDSTARLPALLEALRKGENMVRLDDGTYGMLPEDWLRRFGFLASMGTAEDGHVRFRRSQAGLLDALLASEPDVRCDEAFARARAELNQFRGVEAAPQPAGFVGHLRDYQREGLGWMEFLRRFSFGGCLADDMGVGKTAQVLALLETRRELRTAGQPVGPSLVVVPRSLIFNWKQEAEKFTPKLRVLDYTGVARNTGGSSFDDYDLILTTYGTLRRDVLRLKQVNFDYVVLDESQAIKNSGSESAKAVRLLRGQQRLALSGTPVENHLGELWSLFEFLNPGMLGSAGVFKSAGSASRSLDEDTRKFLATGLRPFILRRTKEQVARELPSKTEQTIYCEMDPPQRKLYNELRQHYRNALLRRVDSEGLAKSKIQVLEALLRLRQAACHPGLLDAKRLGEPSAKLDVLLDQLDDVLEEGHKALVFSQFTSLLSIVRERLDRHRVVYEYLDGSTRDRQARVERFQNDPGCQLFLVSLKAGGLGLNLTAAEYVFLLDPWWNPAVEAQAIDRAHRIGQTRQVFAYRLIARETVEEKVLELQKSKRDLAAAIIGEDNSLIRDLKREDLELLLS